MRIIIFTGNSIRHKFLANSLIQKANESLVVCEARASDARDLDNLKNENQSIVEHFKERREMEEKFFPNNDFFVGNTLPLLYGEVNLKSTYKIVKNFHPDLMFVFGAAIIKEPLLSLLPPGRFINLHLGLSPYYRGSGTNFWPFVNNELEYVGSTILHIDAGIDTGDIITHVRPVVEIGDNVHIVGCKVIKESAKCLIKIMNMVREGKELKRVRQWRVANERYYRKKDFNEASLLKYKKNIEKGLVKKYLETPKSQFRLITF